MSITLKAARVNIGLNQKEAAEALGISKATIQHYESGDSYPDIIVLKKIEDLYHIPYANINFLPKKRA